jgi:hypothetical protein
VLPRCLQTRDAQCNQPARQTAALASTGAPERAGGRGRGHRELASRIVSLHSQARGEINSAVLLLDLAERHAREIEKRMCNESGRKDFDEHIATIERLLQTAREMTLEP